jgi:hypothetical protein
LYYIADPARVANEKSVLRTFYLFKLASSSKLDEKSGIDFAALRRTQLSILKMKSKPPKVAIFVFLSCNLQASLSFLTEKQKGLLAKAFSFIHL